MRTTVKRLFRPPMAMFALWATINIFATFAAPRLLAGTPSSTPPAHATPVASRRGCQFVQAELIDRSGPHGGWCWRITTQCD
jgi:hypothetical protein